MNTAGRFLLGTLGTMLGALAAFAGAESADDPAFNPALQPPHIVAQQMFFNDQLAQIDPLVAALVAADSRDEDGMPELMEVADFLGYAAVPNNGDLEPARQRVQAWLKAEPKSPYAPILEATRMSLTGWRARGRGFSSEVTPEGWEIFHEQHAAAWELLMETRKQSSGIPAWYELAISTGRDGDVPEADIRAVFEEGSRRFPQYYGIYFAYQRDFAPRWGGDYQTADDFILKQVNARSNKDGDALYTRLYWALDGAQGAPRDFFEESRVVWPRMRKGFDLLLASYPNSIRNVTFFGAFACRAHDAETYTRLRPKLNGDNFRDLIRSSYTLDICDRRFAPRSSEN